MKRNAPEGKTMKTEQARAVMDAAEASDISAVWQMSMVAGDNACQTLIEQGRSADRFIGSSATYTDETVVLWHATLVGMLSNESECDPAAVAFYAAHGITA